MDTLELVGVELADLVVGRTGNDLVISIVGEPGSITIESHFVGSSRAIEQFLVGGARVSRANFEALALLGTPNSDTIIGTMGDDRITGGHGDDFLQGEAGSDSYFYALGDGADTISDFGNTNDIDILTLGAGITRNDINLVRVGTTSNALLTINGQSGSILLDRQLQTGGAGVEYIRFADGSQMSRGEIAVAAGIAPTAFTGTASGETLTGSTSDDVISGNGGNDILRGRQGSDRYLYASGDGNDTIDESGYGLDVDILEFTNLTSSQVSFSRSGANLLATVSGTGQTITIDEHFVGVQTGIELIRFSDGTVLDRRQIGLLTGTYGTSASETLTGTANQDVLAGRGGNDTLQGGGGSDLYLYSRGDGADTIIDVADTATRDSLVLGDIAASEVFLVRSGRDLTIQIFDAGVSQPSGSILIKDQFYDTYNRGVEEIVFSDGTVWAQTDLIRLLLDAATSSGDDQITGFVVADELRGGGGNDTLTGLGGNDAYFYARGDGHDVIIEDLHDTGDTLSLEGIQTSDVSLVRTGDTVKLVISESESGLGDGGSITVQNGLSHYGYGVERIWFSDGTEWTKDTMWQRILEESATVGNDQIVGFYGSDVLSGGTGDDTLAGDEGNDTYRYRYGDGHDVIREDIGEGASDVLVLEDIGADDVRVTRSGSTAILTLLDGTGSLSIEGQFSSDLYETGVETISFFGGINWNREDVRARYLIDAPTEQADSITGFDDRDDYIRGGAGDDVLDGLSGRDTLDGGAGNDILRGGDGDDTLLGGDGDDLLAGGLGFDYFDGGEGNDTVDFSYSSSGWTINLASGLAISDGTEETLISIENAIGGTGADSFAGTTGNNRFAGGRGSDSYLFGAGQGDDVIDDDGLTSDQDRLVLDASVASTTVQLFRELGQSSNLVVQLGTGERLIVEGQFDGGQRGIEAIRFSDGTEWTESQFLAQTITVGTDVNDTILGTSTSETFNGRKGNDTITGGSGSDRYLFRKGDGEDTIVDKGASTEIDRIVFADVLASEVIFSRDLVQTNDLIIQYGTDKILIDDHFYTAGWGIDEIQFSDGTVMTRAQIAEMVRLRGTSGADTINGTGSDDRIEGMQGNDTLRGASGSDSYYFSVGDGQDTIDESGNSTNIDKIIFTNITAASVEVSRSITDTTDMIIRYGNAGDEIVIDQQYSGTTYGIEQVVFADGTTWDAAMLQSLARMRGTAGADTINGTSGNDAIEGGAGNDILKGAAGSDTYHFVIGAGEDRIVESGSNSSTDTIAFGVDVSAQDVTMFRDPANTNHLVIEYGVSGDKITVENHFATSNGSGIEQITFAGGTTWSRADILSNLWTGGAASADVLNGTTGVDRLYGGAGVDTLFGGAGDDHIQGGTGNDQITASSGIDTFYFDRGDGIDVVSGLNSADGLDKVLFGPNTNRDDLWFSQSGNDLLISTLGTSDSVKLSNWYGSSTARADIGTLSGSSLIEAQLSQLVGAMADFVVANNGVVPTSPNQYSSDLIAALSAAWSN